MFSKRLSPINLSQSVLDPVEGYTNKGDWDIKNDDIQNFKESLKKAMAQNQNDRCVYCERLLTDNCPEIEHIAPKSIYPELQFKPNNLAFACHRCNFPPHKGKTDIVEESTGEYSNWKFKIVHPYFDDPNDFFVMTGESKCLISIKSSASEEQKRKARYTIKMFDLCGVALTEEREKEKLFYSMDEAEKARIFSISTYRKFD